MQLLERTRLAPGERGTAQSVARIRQQILRDRGNPNVRATAEHVLMAADAAPRDYWAEAEALFEFVRARLRYTKDPIDVEQLTTAEGLLYDTRFADCDEFVILLGALLESVGRPVRLKVVRASPRRPWAHIYLEVKIGAEWIPADATHPFEPMGWEVAYGDARVVPIGAMPGAQLDNDLGFIQALIPIASGLYNAYEDKRANDRAQKAEEKAEKEAKKAKKKKAEKKKADAAAAAAEAEARAAAEAAAVARAETMARPQQAATATAAPQPTPTYPAPASGGGIPWIPLGILAGVAYLLVKKVS